PDPNSAYGPTCAPLLAGPLADWMKLHAQLDPESGWSSPQVLTPEAAELFAAAWPELKPTNATLDRARAFDALDRRHPFKTAYAAFAARDGLPPFPESPRRLNDGVPVKMLPPPALGAVNGVAPVAELPKERERVAPEPKLNDANNAPAQAPAPAPPPRPVVVAVEPTARLLDRGDTDDDAAARRRASGLAANTRQPATYIYPPNYRNNAVEQQFQNNPAVGRNTTQVAPADRAGRDAKADEKGPVGNLATFGMKSGDPTGGLPLTEGADGRYATGPSLARLTDFLARGLAGEPMKDAFRESTTRTADAAKAKGAEMARLHRAEDRGYLSGASGPGGLPGGGGFKGGGFPGGGLGGNAPAPGAPPGLAGPLPRAKAGGDAKDSKAEMAGRGGVNDAKMAPFTAPAAPPAGPPAPPAPAAAGGPMLPTPDPVPPPRLQVAEPVVVVDAPAPPVVFFNPPPVAVHLGPVRPQWLPTADPGPGTLVLVRTAKLDNRTVYQGVEIDWGKLKAVLCDDIKDLFPDAQLVPVKAGDAVPDRAMTALPVQLDPGPAPAPPPIGWSPLRIGLALAWAAALIAFGAIGLAGWSLIDLSERRFRFVSAVTHELRTPLTSLRLYLDLLLSGMVQDEGKRTEYLSTLAVESDRLHRLVDNVLDFARLERRRGAAALHPAKVADLLTTVRDTWTDRCGTDGKELIVVSTLPPDAEVTTDAALVGQIVGNLIDNARKYTRAASDPRVWVWAKPEGRKVVFEVEDRGPGVPPRERTIIFRPFRRGETADTTAGGAGLGLALCKQWAEALGGTLSYRPADGDTGACFRLELPGK
ncbi:MAG TPA: HAMP domain-containing sensor histidine kinase, partial [Urbifossiella sp.]|nr:HAMP domain-containing sensor histidine kinase [Urbifossiella sp.]